MMQAATEQRWKRFCATWSRIQSQVYCQMCELCVRASSVSVDDTIRFHSCINAILVYAMLHLDAPVHRRLEHEIYDHLFARAQNPFLITALGARGQPNHAYPYSDATCTPIYLHLVREERSPRIYIYIYRQQPAYDVLTAACVHLY